MGITRMIFTDAIIKILYNNYFLHDAYDDLASFPGSPREPGNEANDDPASST